MSLATALVAIKTGNATLNTLISTRFHPDVLPQGVTLPAVRFQMISRVQPDYSFQGRPDLANVRVQLDGYAATEVARAALRAAMLGAFVPVSTRVEGSYGSETILDIRIEGEREGLEMLDTNTQARRISMDLIVNMRESQS